MRYDEPLIIAKHMNLLPKIAAIQMTSCSSIETNLATAARLLKQAADDGASLAVLPEMFSTLAVENGTLDAAETFGNGPLQQFLATQAQQHHMWIVGGTIAIKSEHDKKAYAACLVYDHQGKLIARYNKMHLFDACLEHDKEVYRESENILHGDTPVVFDSPLGKIGLAVCYDLRFAELFHCLSQQGADIFIIPSAFTYNTGLAHWEILCRARAIENLAYVIAADQSGEHTKQRRSYGHSMIVDPWGKILCQVEQNEGVLCQAIDLQQVTQARKKLPVLEHRKL